MIDRELLEEMRQDMLREAYEDSMIEHKMRTDFDYFMEVLFDAHSEDIYELKQSIIKDLDEYGWDIPVDDVLCELVDEVQEIEDE